MNEKDKAFELYNKFITLGYTNPTEIKEMITIMLDEFTKELNIYVQYNENDVIDPVAYWNNVKVELMALK